MAIIAKYKFNPSLYADYLPTFNAEFTGYTKTDVTNSDGTITRTISHDTLKPTIIRFGTTSSGTNREKSLLEVVECDTSQVTNMNRMFQECRNLTSINLSSFNTSKVTDMLGMFVFCSSLTSLDLSSFDTSKVTNMNSMFNSCSKLTSLDLSNFDTSQVTNMSAIFSGCSLLTSLDVSSFNTSKLTDMSFMFRFCPLLTSLDLSSFNTSQVTNMANMFDGCSSLNSLDLSNWNTSKVTNMSHMFNQCPTSDIGLLYATSSTINTLLTHLGTSVARNVYYTDAALNELTVQDNITYKKYELSKATLPYTLNKLPNGVADYIDVVNKVYVQRVGIATVIGDNMRTVGAVGTDDYRFEITNTLNVNTTSGWWGTVGSDLLYAHSAVRNVKGYNKSVILYPVDRNMTLVDFQTVLQTNPVTVLYPLSTPIYTPLTDEEIAQLPLSAYADGCINLSSDQLMPSFEFRMRASNRYQVDMLETGYYYLNAPVGNVKLGTANVDVQQMPCIVKVDNVGTGDSGYRLRISNGFCEDVKLTVDGYYLNIYNGELLVNSSRATSDYVYIDYYDDLCVEDLGNREYFDMVFYDEDKRYISYVSWDMVKNYGRFKAPRNAKYFRVSIVHKGNKVTRVFAPTTLAKLPSHRIPSPFTQGMKCGTNFGYWEGIKEAQTYGVQTANKTTIGGFGTIELYGIEIGGSFIEDEFDISIGKLTKRIGVKKLVGIEDWKVVGSVLENSVLFQLSMDGVMAEANTSTNYVFNDKYPRKTGDRLWSTETYGVGGNTDVIRIRLNLPYRTVDEFKRFLSLNPITVYYRLRVPEITYLTPQFSQMEATNSSTRINVLKNSANNKLFPQCKPSHLTYPVPSLVGNREYTVVHNRKNITGSTKPITLDLGGTQVELNNASGKTLVKTPSSLKHSSLIFIGGESTVDHVMVLDGDWTNKPIEYFENMKGHDTDAIITIIGNGQINDVAEQYLW